LFDAQGERLTPSHAVKNGRRYRYYISAALMIEAGTDRALGWRLPAQEIEGALIRVLADALTNPAVLLQRFGTADTPSEQARKMVARATQLAAALNRSAAEQARVVRDLVETVVVDAKTITIKVRPRALAGKDVPSTVAEDGSDRTIELTAAVAFKRRGVETKLVLPGLTQPNHSVRCDPALIKAIARGRAWFEALATGRARSLQVLAKRDGITERYVRRLVSLAFLSPQLVEEILQGRQPVELTTTRLTGLDLPLDWSEQHRLLAN
jgi:hypothetical protein